MSRKSTYIPSAIGLRHKAMDEVRKSERRRNVELKGHKYTFLKSPKQLTEDQSVQQHTLVELYPQLGGAYRPKELFDDFWTMKTPQEARGFLAFWCDMTQDSEIAPFLAFVKYPPDQLHLSRYE